MKSFSTLGRLLFVIAILAFGVMYLAYAATGAGLGPPWTPQNRALACFGGIVLLAAATTLAMGRYFRIPTILFALVCLIRAVFYYGPSLITNPRDPLPWTRGFELVAMCGAALVVASILSSQARTGMPASAWFHLGRLLYASLLLVVGIQHFMYGPFIAGLIPAWIPGRLFWAYFVGVAFFAAFLAIVSGKVARLAATLLGLMFFLWVLILHGPRVAAALHNANEWTSLLVALAMSGGAFAIAGVFAHEE